VRACVGAYVCEAQRGCSWKAKGAMIRDYSGAEKGHIFLFPALCPRIVTAGHEGPLEERERTAHDRYKAALIIN
jgi:hypothetical protein